MKPLFSIIIPVRVVTPHLLETKTQLKAQSFSDFEVIIVDDRLSGIVSPSIKRNLGVKMAKGTYLAFLDDDSYPAPNWLETANSLFLKHPNISAVCGPQLTPPQDDWTRQATGLVVSSWLGSGGAGQYRNTVSPSRFVDDYPSVNLIVRKADFEAVSGFDTHHWPGEDTLLCLNLTSQLGKKILYHPDLRVYHHRRSSPLAYLTQIGRYALHRGHFAKIAPKTSLKLGYLAPTIFVFYLFLLLPLAVLTPHPLFFAPLFLYLVLALATYLKFLLVSGPKISTLAILTLVLSHLYYGFLFPQGYLKPKLSFQPHPLNSSQNRYQGG